jgi:hypothetical protein
MQRPPVTNDAIGEPKPALGPFADSREPRFAIPERKRSQIDASSIRRSKAT